MYKSQSGIALITVLLIIAVIIIIVGTMNTQQAVDIRRTANLRDRGQAYTYALGGEALAKLLLQQDQDRKADYYGTGMNELWSQPLPAYPVEEGSISGEIRDQNGCFNLNNLVQNGVDSQEDIQRFKRLLVALKLSPDLADAVVDWIDSDNQVYYPDGAESDYYSRLQTPYAIANRPMISSSELAAVKGMTPEILAKLNPQVCALPKHTKININTATPEVLMTLAPGMTPTIAQAIIAARDAPVDGVKGHFKQLADLYAVPQFNAILNSAMQVQINKAYGVASNFFLVVSDGNFDKSDVVLYSLLERSGKTITSYYRAQGSY